MLYCENRRGGFSVNGLKNKKLFLLDMDGTLYLGEQLFAHCLDFLAQIKENGGRYLFLTNNSSKSVNAYVDKLCRLGIAADKDDFFTSADAACVWLREHYRGNKLYVLGTASLREQLTAAGFPVTDRVEDDVDGLLMGFDTEITFQKLEDACILLNKDIPYMATNPDLVCPTEYGYVPDCGSVSEMIFNATGKRPFFIGKPEPAMALLAMQKCGVDKADTVLIGDRIYTDIACGINAGIDTVLVFSGETTREVWAASEQKPTYTCDSITDIWEVLKTPS